MLMMKLLEVAMDVTTTVSIKSDSYISVSLFNISFPRVGDGGEYCFENATYAWNEGHEVTTEYRIPCNT